MNLRPLGIGELLDAAFKVCFAHWRTLLRIVLFVVVPVQVLSAVVVASTLPEDFANPFAFDQDATTVDGDDAGTAFAGFVAIGLLAGLMFLLSTGACFRAITEAWLGHRPDWRDSLGFALRRTPALLWVSVLYFVVCGFAFLLLIVPGVWAAVAFALVFPIVLVERVGGFAALRRSFRLVKGRWWATFGVLVIGFLLATVISTIAQYVVSLPILFASDSAVSVLVLGTLGAIVGYVIATPLQAALVALVYFDLRVRKEGLDLALVAERLGTTAPGAAPAGAPAAPAPAAVPTAAPASSLWSGGEWQPPPGWRPPSSDR